MKNFFIDWREHGKGGVKAVVMPETRRRRSVTHCQPNQPPLILRFKRINFQLFLPDRMSESLTPSWVLRPNEPKWFAYLPYSREWKKESSLVIAVYQCLTTLSKRKEILHTIQTETTKPKVDKSVGRSLPSIFDMSPHRKCLHFVRAFLLLFLIPISDSITPT